MERSELSQTDAAEEVTPQLESYQPPLAVVVGKVEKLTMGKLTDRKDGSTSADGYQAS